MLSDPTQAAMAEYADALARISALQALDGEAINPLCRTQLLTHGRKVERAMVFLHGFTNCPQQFAGLAQTLFERGWNVLNVRLPHHGLRDRLTGDLANMRADEMIAFTADAVEMAHGLGEHVTLAGLSLGGTLALRAAQQRPDLDRAVAIAPMIAPPNVPRWLLPWLVGSARLLPNFFIWWDSRTKAKMPGPQHAYPRFASRALAEMLVIAARVESDAFRAGARPPTKAILLVTNAADPAVDSAAAKAVTDRWRANGAQNIETYEFAAALELMHDIIDKDQPAQRTELVYPILIDLIDRR
jgi:carboxylesterase